MSASVSNYRYRIEMTYVDTKTNRTKQIMSDSIKYLMIDHDYDKNCAPVLLVDLWLDKAMVDDMILNMDRNLITMALYKYDELLNHVFEIECFRKQFCYFTTRDINKSDAIDYTDDSTPDNMFREIYFGLMCVDHINNNMRTMEFNLSNVSMAELVSFATNHFDNIVIEPLHFNETFKHYLMPQENKISRVLHNLNEYRVFYRTPYRFYQDFNCTYLISSSGYAIPRRDEKYTSVVIDIKDILDLDSNDPGIITDRSSGSYRILVNSAATQIINNSVQNRAVTSIRAISDSGVQTRDLDISESFGTKKFETIRINNGNLHMLDNVVAKRNSSVHLISITKNDLDTDAITINKNYQIHNVDRHMDKNGSYLLLKKQEIYLKDDHDFIMASQLTFAKIGTITP